MASLSRKGNTRHLLEDVSGCVAPGKLTALMGESGEGKTTLLNVLAEHQAAGVVGSFYKGCIQQTDTHLAQTTVCKALLFSTKLQQPPTVPLKEKEAYISTVLKVCSLDKYANVVAGSLGLKHWNWMTIGVELMAKLPVRIRRLHIHQPSAKLFQEFDRPLLLWKGGQTVYFGDIRTNSMTLVDYFQKNGRYPCPPDTNLWETMHGTFRQQWKGHLKVQAELCKRCPAIQMCGNAVYSVLSSCENSQDTLAHARSGVWSTSRSSWARSAGGHLRNMGAY
ncbi:hypothetical protein H4582DRAFT_2065221 [Lactarius indigo]|nr:hypothetical protein H4582DRAFT_2065221 [Lactarius indigo]